MRDWPTLPVRRLFSVVNGGTPTADADNWGGAVPWATPVDLARVNGSVLTQTDRTLTDEGLRTGSSAVPGGSLLLSTRAPIGYVAETFGRTSFNQGCRGLVPTRAGVVRFFRYQFASLVSQLNAWGQGSTFVELSGDALAAFPLVAPAVAAQRAIADYLDRETARIDALVSAKRQMVELLGERQSELATHLLLGPPVAGGSAGPGQVTPRPRWSTVPFRRLFREIDVRSATGSETLLSVSQTRGVIPQTELGERRQYAETLAGYKICMRGDLVVNRMWVYYGALGAASVPGIVSPDYAVFRPTAEMSSEFAAYVLRTPAYVGEMTRLVRGIGAAFQGTVRKPRLHPSELGLIQMPVPTPAEQQLLLRALDEKTEAMAQRVVLLQRSMRLLEERRRALVTAAVTGALDISEAA